MRSICASCKQKHTADDLHIRIFMNFFFMFVIYLFFNLIVNRMMFDFF